VERIEQTPMEVNRVKRAASAQLSTRNGPRLFTCLLGIAILSWVCWPQLRQLPHSVSDFSAFWVAGQQAGHGDLYDRNADYAFDESLGHPQFYRYYQRLPWQAMIAKPFTLLPYSRAVWLWVALMALCAVLFIFTVPATLRWNAAMALSWSAPLANGLAGGQDVAMVLLAFGVSMWASRNRHRWWAGVALAICGLKIHLFLPVLLIALIRRELVMLAGFSLTTAALLGASFLIQPNWMTGMEGITKWAWHWDPAAMPNLHLLFLGHPVLEIASAILVLAACCVAAIRLDGELALSLGVAAGVLIMRHAFNHDLILVYPLGLSLWTRSRLASLLILSPFPAWLYLNPVSDFASRVMAVTLLSCILVCAFLSGNKSTRVGV
jgi:hypothetical protein